MHPRPHGTSLTFRNGFDGLLALPSLMDAKMLCLIPRFAVGIMLVTATCASLFAQDVQIKVQADRVLHKVSPYLTGACLEDVNHEVYGGIDSQMIFGESFQEPPTNPPQGFRVLGGRWQVRDGEVAASGIPGDKLISTLPAFANGEVSVECFIPDRQTTNVGLITRVQADAPGMDNFEGYEISLNAAAQYVLLGRHRHNWEHIQNTPCEIPTNAWVKLSVKLDGKTLEIFVNDRSILKYVDAGPALLKGTVGLRQFQRDAKYRKLSVKSGNESHDLSFISSNDLSKDVSGMWRAVRTGDVQGEFALETKSPFVGSQSQSLTLTSGTGSIGIENQGLNRWGMSFTASSPYEGRVWARAEQPTEIVVALQDRAGTRTVAEATLQVTSTDWQPLKFTLTPDAEIATGRMSVLLRKPGTVTLGYVLLQPGKWGRFKGLPVRLDVAEGLIGQWNTVLRYGGSMINHPDYRWKKMIGPRDRRPPYSGTWYRYSSNGWGILDFLNFCEAANFLAIPAFHMGESAQDMADFIEYVHGPATSEWGQQRTAGTHPQPYQLKYIELGNEERIDDAYFEKFKPLAEAIWARDPQITIVVGDFVYGQRIEDPMKFGGAASGITTLAAHKKILQLAKQHQREVWFDLHVGTDGPRPDSTLAATLSYIDALEKLADGAKFKVAVFELNSGNHSQRRALANAIAIQAFARDGRVPVVTAANCLQPDGQNDNDWNQGLLFLNPSKVWLQPPGYVTQLFARHMQRELISCDVANANDRLDVIATRSIDGKRVVLQVVNPTDAAVPAEVQLSGFSPTKPTAQGWELSGPLSAANTAAQSSAIVPQRREWSLGDAKSPRYSFPPYSITFLILE